MSNPYETPTADGIPAPDPANSFREIVLPWEKLRLLYNAILLLPGIAAMIVPVAGGMSILVAVVMALALGIGANVAFFMGPAAELYFRALFLQEKPAPLLRRMLFIGGLALSFGGMGVFVLGILFAIR